MNRTRTLIASFALAALFASPALAARADHAQVLVDGKVVWDTIITSRGSDPIETVWPKLANRATKLQGATPEPADAKTMTFRGKVTLRIKHVDRVLGEANLDRLMLMRTDRTKNAWHIPEAEVRRAAKAAGIEMDD